MGYAFFTDRAGRVREEFDTKLCGHCQRLIMYATRARPDSDYGGWCMRCGKVLCRDCTDARKCVPFEEQLKRSESHGAFLRSVGLES